MSSIFQGQIGKYTSAERKDAYEKSANKMRGAAQIEKDEYKSVNISKLKEDIIYTRDGGKKEVHPAAVARLIKMMIDDMRNNREYAFIKPYLDKPVIWTYEVKTACTNGVRIFMNPVFAEMILNDKHGKKEAEEFWATLNALERSDNANITKYRMIQTRYVRFIIIHEVYHVLYNHVRRAILKYGSHPSLDEKNRGNIAMDLEINRDIESTFPDLIGSTNEIGGIWFESSDYFSSKGKPFKKDIWEDIWDDWTEWDKNFNPSNPFNSSDVNPKQKNKAKLGPYADGWRKAVDAIKKKQIDPRAFTI